MISQMPSLHPSVKASLTPSEIVSSAPSMMPSNVPNFDGTQGISVKCSSNSDGTNNPNRVYRYFNGVLRYYPNPTVASQCDPQWSNFQFIDCTGLPILGKIQSSDCIWLSVIPSKLLLETPSDAPRQEPTICWWLSDVPSTILPSMP